MPSSAPSCLPQRHYRELMKRDRGHAHHHQSLALGIGADALGELYWLPDELPDALRSGARLRMCTVHDGIPELARLSRLRKSQIKGLLGSELINFSALTIRS